MTRKLGRLLVVALVVAAVAVPMSVASADIGPQLVCKGIPYDADNPYHIVYPTALDFHIRFFADQWELWDIRHHGADWSDFGGADAVPYLVFDMEDVSDILGAPPAGENYVFFWNDVVYGDPEWDPDIPVRIVGTEYDDVICGSPDNDVIRGLAGDDYIVGGSVSPSAGGDDDDIIQGGAGDDVLIGGRGSDGLTGNGGDDTLFGLLPEGAADDFGGPYPYGGPSMPSNSNELYGGPGNDTIYASTDIDLNDDGDCIDPGEWCAPSAGDAGYGGPGDDTLIGGSEMDYFEGRTGNDVLKGGPNQDYLYGGPGDDQIWGEAQADMIVGNAGDDILYATSPADVADTTDDVLTPWATGMDYMYGQQGNDQLWGGHYSEGVMMGGKGHDVINTSDGDSPFNTVFGGPGADTITGGKDINNLRGGPDNDTINGGKGVDFLYGDGGDDLIYGGSELDALGADLGGDIVFGGAGYDDIFGEGGHDALFGDDAVAAATDGADWISGGTGVDTIQGGGGADVIYGDAGGDVIFAGYSAVGPPGSADTAADSMFGGAGGDVYWGACADLDKATEDTDPAAENDLTYYVPGLFPFTTYFEGGTYCP